MTIIRIHPEAAAELRDGAQWYQERAGLGNQFAGEVSRLLDRIVARPETFPVWLPNRRYPKALVRRFPYVVFFRLLEGEAQVFAVAHAKRKPGYWLSRTR